MPQISSMNWIMISIMSTMLLLLSKTNSNKSFLSKKSIKKNLTKKSNMYKW